MKTNSIIKSALFAAGFSAVALIGSAQAQVVNVDINESGGSTGTYSGQGAYSDPGNNYWNALNVPSQTGGHSFTASNLIDSSDDAGGTGISFNVNSTTESFLNSYDTGVTHSGIAPALLDDFAYGYASTALNFSFSGLVSGDTYNIFLYTGGGGYYSGGADFTIDGTSMQAANSASGTDTTSFVAGKNYVEFVGVIADGSGDITGTDTVGSASNGVNYFNGAQIVNTTPVEAPEPSTVALIGLGALGLAFLVVRRRHSLV